MEKWEYRVINISYRDGSDFVITSVSSNYHRVFSNILKDEFEAYLKQLGEEGWELEDVHGNDAENGMHEAYYLKRLIERD